jgi:hypothetical protein
MSAIRVRTRFRTQTDGSVKNHNVVILFWDTCTIQKYMCVRAGRIGFQYTTTVDVKFDKILITYQLK